MRCNLLTRIVPLPLLALQLCSCQDFGGIRETETSCLLLSVGAFPAASVKTSTEAEPYEDKISSLQILVFNESGYLDKYLNAGTTTDGIELPLPAGKKTVWAVAGGGDLSGIATDTALESVMIGLSESSREKGFVMTGYSGCTLTPAARTSCTVTVRRLACRVALEEITNSLPSAYGQIRIVDAWLSHVAGNCTVTGGGAPTLWYNTDGYCGDNALTRPLLYQSIGSDVGGGKSLTLSDTFFYCLPNGTEHPTALVVKALVGSKTCYYPVLLDMAPLQCNATYSVRLTVTGLGSDDPDVPVEKGTVSVSVVVAPWAEGTDYDATI